MLREIDPRTALTPPPNMSYLSRRDTGYILILQSEALTVLYLFVRLFVPVGL